MTERGKGAGEGRRGRQLRSSGEQLGRRNSRITMADKILIRVRVLMADLKHYIKLRMTLNL